MAKKSKGDTARDTKLFKKLAKTVTVAKATTAGFASTAGLAGNASLLGGLGRAADAILAVVRARNLSTHPNDVQVNLFTSFSDAETIGQGFHLMVLCP